VRKLALLCAVASAVLAAPASASRADYLASAKEGLGLTTARFWNGDGNWYNDDVEGDPASMPLARLWSAYPLFETLNGIAIADPTPANKAAAKSFADEAHELYWNPDLKPYGGYGWYPRQRGSLANVYFDDTGWWGLSFIDAHAATGDAAYLTYAHRALVFIVRTGWDAKNGGLWWDTRHHHKTIEPLAAAVLIGTRLYEEQHRVWDLRWALKLLKWANVHSFNTAQGLYGRSATDDTVMDYAQGMMITANWELCKSLHRPWLCTKARQLANACARTFPQDLNWAPQFDVVYLRWMLEYYRDSGDRRWYDLALHNAQRAQTLGQDQRGLYTNRWDGTPLADGLEEHAASTELFAWIAATDPPGS
jgi:hypothetical protein